MGEWREEWWEANRASWDERVPIHVSGEFYDVAAFREGQERLQPFEIDEVGDVTGKELLHLQCHFGIDTLSWARRGARVTGLDFSAPAVDATGGLTFDIVYTGRGAIIWLPDIGRWAKVVADLLKPGGFLYLTEFHPFTEVFGDEDLSLEYDYFQDENPRVWEEPGTYADFDAETSHNVTYEWNHTLGDVVSAVSAAGLNVELLHEYDYTMFPRWPILEKSGFDTYRLPEGTPRIPLMYSLRARKA